MADSATPQEMLELFQRMVNPMALPMQSLLFPQLNKEDLDKKIGELRAVEGWLTANLGMLRMSIKMLEYQRSLLAGEGSGEQKVENPFANPGLWPWGTMPATPEPQPEPPADQTEQARKKK